MEVTETAAGTPVIDLTQEEYDAYLERQVQRELGMTVAEFIEAYTTGKVDDSHPAVGYLIGKLCISQNGHKAAA
jgi:hypothetical protein